MDIGPCAPWANARELVPIRDKVANMIATLFFMLVTFFFILSSSSWNARAHGRLGGLVVEKM
jgi:hypothetical protein